MKNNILIFLVIFIMHFSFSVYAYEQDTHRKISERAFDESMLSFNPFSPNNILNQFGLSIQDEFFNSKNYKVSIQQLVADGSEFEDDGSRPTKHFFNPLTGSGIDPFKSSPEFMLTDFLGEGQRGGGANPYTYPDAVEYFYRAMTLPAKTERDANWGRLSEHESYTNSRGKIT